MTFTPAFPVGTTFMPGDAVVLRVFEDRYLTLMSDVVAENRQFVTALISAGSEVGGHDQRFDAGVLVEVDHVEPADFGIMMHGHATRAVTISEWNDEALYPRARVVVQDQELLEGVVFEECFAGLRLLAEDIDGLIRLMEMHDISHPTPPGGALFFVDMDIQNANGHSLWEALWSLVRLLPSSPLARYELLRPASFLVRLARARDEVVHLSEIITFRFGS